MLNAKVWIASVLSGLLLCANVFADFENYELRPLKVITEQHQDSFKEMKGDKNLVFTADNFPSKGVFVFTGKARAILPVHKMIIIQWMKTFNPQLMDLAEAYAEEFLFTQNGTSYWLPVQAGLVGALRDELKAEDHTYLYTTWLGGTKLNGKPDFVFTVNEFERIEPQK